MNYFYNNRLSAYMLFAATVILGIIGFSRLPLSLVPTVAYPGISIIIEYPGNSPEKIESIITKNVEKVVKTLPGIEKIDSVSEEGQSRININFKLNTDIKLAALQVREKIGIIRSSFPPDVQEPVVMRYDPTNKPAIIATIDMPNSSMSEIRDYAERKIKPKLQQVDGVSEINIAGGAQKEMHVDINSAKFEGRKLSYNELYSAIQNSNISLPGGQIVSGSMEYNLTTSMKYKTADEIADTAVFSGKDLSLVKISEFAKAYEGSKEKEDYSRYNGEEKVTIYVHQAGDANSLTVCGAVEEILSLQKECSVKIIYNQSDYMKSALLNIVVSFAWGAFLIFFVLYFFFRRTDVVLVILITIPVSLLSAFLVMYYLGIELNMMSLSGLSLGASIIIDNGIVLVSAIHETKKITFKSVVDSVLSLKTAIIASTFSTLVVFFPILFSNEQTRQTYRGLSYTIAVVLLISLFVVLIMIPVLTIDMHNNAKFKKAIADFENMVFRLRIIVWINQIISGRVNSSNIRKRIIAQYLDLLTISLRNSRYIVIILVVSLVLAAISFMFVKREMVDPMSTGEFYVYIEFPTGTTLEKSNESVRLAEEMIKKMGCAQKLTSKVEKWRGTLTVKFKDSISSNRAKESEKKKIREELAKEMRSRNGFVYMTEAEASNARELDITILGSDNEQLRSLAKESARRISSIKGIDDMVLRFRDGCPEFRLTVDRNKANLSGLSALEIGSFVRTSLFGPVVTKFIDKDREIDLRMRIDPEHAKSVEDITGLSIVNSVGISVPLREVVSVSEAEGDTKIWRQNGKRCVTITAKLGRLSYEDAVSEIDKELEKISWPEDYSYAYDDIIKNLKETRSSMSASLILAITLVFMILAAKFESLLVPFSIIIAVPLSFAGVISALFLFGISLSLSVYIGLIVLIGIIVNNGIVLVEKINNEYLHGKINRNNILKKIVEASFSRLKPVSITAITTMLAMIPALVRGGDGSNLWRPLSFTVITGLIFSYFITLIIIPVLCSKIYSIKMKYD